MRCKRKRAQQQTLCIRKIMKKREQLFHPQCTHEQTQTITSTTIKEGKKTQRHEMK